MRGSPASAIPSLTLKMEIYPEGSDRLLTTIETVYVGFYPKSETTRPVPDAIRALVDHYEATGEALPLDRFPELAQATGELIHEESQELSNLIEPFAIHFVSNSWIK